MKTALHTKICTWKFIVALFITIKTWSHSIVLHLFLKEARRIRADRPCRDPEQSRPTSPPLVKQTGAHSYHGILFSKKEKWISKTHTAWMDLKEILLLKQSQSPKVTYIRKIGFHLHNTLEKTTFREFGDQVRGCQGSGVSWKFHVHGRKYDCKRTKWGLLVMELFSIFTVLVGAWTYTRHKIVPRHIHTHTHMYK